jgi:hypothetical protein
LHYRFTIGAKVTHPKAARISPDSRQIAYGAASLAGAIYLGAFATSFFGQASLAAYMLIPTQLQYVAPAVVDFALILFTLATLVRRSRGESTLITNLATGFWTAVSIAANIFHVLVPAGPQASWSAGTYAGAALSALMPLAALGASLVIETVLIERPGAETEPAADIEQVIEVAPVQAEPKAAEPIVQSSPAADHLLEMKKAPASPETLTVPASAPIAVQVLTPAKTVAPLPASPAVPVHGPVSDSKVDWQSLTRSERDEQFRSLRAADWSVAKIAAESGASESTIKRATLEPAARQLQPA